jgi:uroporphyrinogen decarboxylase
MTGRERILAALGRRAPDRVPTFEWFIDAGVCEALTGTPDPVVAADRLDLDGINVRADYRKHFIDATTFVDEWGIHRTLTGDCIPCVRKSPIADLTRHAEFTFPDPAATDRFQTLERALRIADGKRAVILNLRDGFSDMRDLLGYEEALIQVLEEPEHFAALLDRVVEYNLSLARLAVERYGLEIIATTDDVATKAGPLFSPQVYFDVIGPSFRKVVRGYRELGCLVIKHSDGDVALLADFWIESGINCLDPVDPSAGVELAEARAKYGDRVALKGNVDCAGVLQYGTPADVRVAVRECLAQGGYSGHILSSSNTIHRGVKPENYRAMLDVLREVGGGRMEEAGTSSSLPAPRSPLLVTRSSSTTVKGGD